ncbi:MAG: hypothetical protein COA88_06440 [Kordia sp.]|nr:MAG: hypothetical protein COA88_06440 [Kordia sp.]
MEKTITVKNEYNSLDTLHNFLKSTSSFECSKDYDIWEHRTDANGQMEQCIVLKKSSMHGMKVFFQNENTLKMTYIIPNKIMDTYFGKSVRARKDIIQIVTGIIKQAVLAPGQKKAFEEMEQVFHKISV